MIFDVGHYFMKITSIILLCYCSLIYCSDSPTDVVKYYLSSFDNSNWALNLTAEYALRDYLETLSEIKKAKFNKLFDDNTSAGPNLKFIELFKQSTEITGYKNEIIKDEKASVVVVLKELKSGKSTDVEYRLIKIKNIWKIYSNGIPGDDGSKIRKRNKELYLRLENDLGFDGVIEFIKRTILENEDSKTVLNLLKKKNAQQVDAPEPATMVSPASQTPQRPAR